MTAEERAREVFRTIDARSVFEATYADVMDVADAIRAAENDALERAAKCVEAGTAACRHRPGMCAQCDGRRVSAEIVLSLRTGGSR